ncbi:MAG: hypothetical protein MHM6MM_002784 [Cercozoa sp. M6MM]
MELFKKDGTSASVHAWLALKFMDPYEPLLVSTGFNDLVALAESDGMDRKLHNLFDKKGHKLKLRILLKYLREDWADFKAKHPETAEKMLGKERETIASPALVGARTPTQVPAVAGFSRRRPMRKQRTLRSGLQTPTGSTSSTTSLDDEAGSSVPQGMSPQTLTRPMRGLSRDVRPSTPTESSEGRRANLVSPKSQTLAGSTPPARSSTLPPTRGTATLRRRPPTRASTLTRRGPRRRSANTEQEEEDTQQHAFDDDDSSQSASPSPSFGSSPLAASSSPSPSSQSALSGTSPAGTTGVSPRRLPPTRSGGTLRRRAPPRRGTRPAPPSRHEQEEQDPVTPSPEEESVIFGQNDYEEEEEMPPMGSDIDWDNVADEDLLDLLPPPSDEEESLEDDVYGQEEEDVEEQGPRDSLSSTSSVPTLSRDAINNRSSAHLTRSPSTMGGLDDLELTQEESARSFPPLQELIATAAYTGCMRKRGKEMFKRKWRQRYFVLCDGYLYWSRTAKDEYPLACLPLRDLSGVKFQALTSTQFEVRTPAKDFVFEAPGMAEMDEWEHQFNVAINMSSSFGTDKQADLADVDVQTFSMKDDLIAGTKFKKYKHGKGKTRFVWISDTLDRICWGEKRDEAHIRNSIDIDLITGVQDGCVGPKVSDQIFALTITTSGDRNLELLARNERTKRLWCDGIRQLVALRDAGVL